MGISIGNAKIGRDKNKPKEKCQLGRHLVRCSDLRQKQTRDYGNAFFLDFEVVEGPSGAGFTDTFKVYPESTRPTGGKITKAQAKELDEGKCVIAVAAVAGHTREAASSVVTQEFFNRATAVEERKTNENAKSPFVGALFELEAFKAASGYVFYEVYPYLPATSVFGPSYAKPAAAPAAVKAKPALPVAKKVEPTFPPAPWAFHPEDATFVYNEETEECIEAEELKARLLAA